MWRRGGGVMIMCGCGCRTTGVGGFVFLPLVLLLFFGNLRRMQENNCETFSPKLFFVQCTPRTVLISIVPILISWSGSLDVLTGRLLAALRHKNDIRDTFALHLGYIHG